MKSVAVATAGLRKNSLVVSAASPIVCAMLRLLVMRYMLRRFSAGTDSPWYIHSSTDSPATP